MRPIDANVVVKGLVEIRDGLKEGFPKRFQQETIRKALRVVEESPTIDAEPVWIVHRKDGIYDVYKGNRDNWVIARLSADNIFAWLAEQNLVDIRFVDESIPNCGAEMDLKD